MIAEEPEDERINLPKVTGKKQPRADSVRWAKLGIVPLSCSSFIQGKA